MAIDGEMRDAIPVDRLSVLDQTFMQVAKVDEAQTARDAIVHDERDDQLLCRPDEQPAIVNELLLRTAPETLNRYAMRSCRRKVPVQLDRGIGAVTVGECPVVVPFFKEGGRGFSLKLIVATCERPCRCLELRLGYQEVDVGHGAQTGIAISRVHEHDTLERHMVDTALS